MAAKFTHVQNMEKDQKELTIQLDGGVLAHIILGSCLDKDRDDATSWVVISSASTKDAAARKASELMKCVPHPTARIPTPVWDAIRRAKKLEVDFWLDNEQIREVAA